MAVSTYQKQLQNNDIHDKFVERASTLGAAIDTVETRQFYNDLNASIKSKASLIMNADTIAEGKILDVKPYVRNLLLRTEEFDHAYWTKRNSTITANATTAPDGTLTADKLVENTANAEHNVTYGWTGTNQRLTLSVYAKAAERNFLRIRFANDIGNASNA